MGKQCILFHYQRWENHLLNSCSDSSSGRDSEHSLCEQLRMGVCWCRCQVAKHDPLPQIHLQFGEGWRNCDDANVVAFHPFKIPEVHGLMGGKIRSCFAWKRIVEYCMEQDVMTTCSMETCWSYLLLMLRACVSGQVGEKCELLQFVQTLGSYSIWPISSVVSKGNFLLQWVWWLCLTILGNHYEVA